MKRVNLKKVFAIALTAVMTFTLIACGATNDVVTKTPNCLCLILDINLEVSLTPTL